MDTDKALQAANPLGRTQGLILLASCLMQTHVGYMQLSTIFIAETPSLYNNCSRSVHINLTSPDHHQLICGSFPENSSSELMSCSECSVFDTIFLGKSIVTEWELIGKRDFLPGLSQSLMLAGYTFGCVIAGPLADLSGRLTISRVWLSLLIIVGFSVSLSPNYAAFVTLRTLFGVSTAIVRVPVLTLQYEYLIPRYRGSVGSIPFCSSTVLIMILPAFAYYVRDWRFFHLVVMFPALILFFVYWFLPDSLRWYVSRGKLEKAEKIMQSIAKSNGVNEFPSEVFTRQILEKSEEPVKDIIRDEHWTPLNDHHVETPDSGILQLFKTPTLPVTVVLCWCGFTQEILYYAFALSVGSLAGNYYFNCFLLFVVDTPGRILSVLLLKRIGGLKMILVGLTTSSIILSCVVIASLISDNEHAWLIKMLAVCGKFVHSATLMAPLYLLVAELFPTQVRNTARGVQQFSTGVGGMITPLLLYMDKFVPNLLFMVLALLSLLSAGLCLLLPDAQNEAVPETPEDLALLISRLRLIKCARTKYFTVKTTNEDNL